MQNLYKFLLITCSIVIISLGGYVYYMVTYESGMIKITGYVNDFAKKLDVDFINSINTVCQNLSQKTRIDIVTVIMSNTRPFENKPSYDPSDYVKYLLKSYESTHPDIAGAVVMLVTIAEGKINIAISPRIQFIFPPSAVDRILDENVIPMLNEADKLSGELISKNEHPIRANEFIGRGILDGVRAIAQKISDEHAKQKFTDDMIKLRKQEDVSTSKWSFSWWFYAGVLFLVALISLIVKVQFKLRCPKCYFRLKITEETIEVPENDKPGLLIEVVQCNHCGYYDMKRIVTYARSFYLSHLYDVIVDIVKSYYRKKKREYRKKNYNE